MGNNLNSATADSNMQLMERFYTAFQARDSAAMIACYHPEVHFSDPVFTDLRGERAGAMWEMLCEGGEDLKIEFRDVSADEHTGRAHWDAWYTFGTGRSVHNRIDATFEFRDGKVIRHVDSFDLHSWASQALGITGRLLGRFGFFQNKIRESALKQLEKHTSREK